MISCKNMFFLVIFTVSSGSVTVNKDSSVQVLAEEAHPIDRFDRDVSNHYRIVFMYHVIKIFS